VREHRELLSAIRAAPQDDSVRQVYADWLEQEGQEAEAAVVRAEIAVHAAPGDPSARESLRETLHQARGAASARWLLQFEQPSLLRTPPLPLPAVWWASDLGEYRRSQGTYERYSYASLPDLDLERASGLDWLSSQPRTRVKREEQPLRALQRRVKKLGYTLPPEMVAVFRQHLPVRPVITSFTNATFDISPELWRPVPLLGGLLVPFYKDPMSVVSWGLWLHRSGAQAVLSFLLQFGLDEPSGPQQEPPLPDLVPFDDERGAGRFEFVSPSFTSFLYRLQLECQIWYALLGMGGPARVFTPEQQRYLEHYERSRNDHRPVKSPRGGPTRL
jgi:uncharacterized protein (TIGR02996 family)